MNIDKKDWHVCKICNKNIKDLSKEYGGSGIFYTEVFVKHLENDHNTNPEEYFSQLSERPKCSCKECNQFVNLKWKGSSQFKWRKYKCGRNKGVKKWSEWAKKGRAGNGNPMYNKKPWNKNKTKYTSDIVMNVSKKLTNRHISDITKQRQSDSAKKRKVHGHTGHKHSESSKEKMRVATLNQIKNGKFPHTKTKPHLKVAEILQNLGIAFQEEYVIKYWSFDFYLTDLHVLIEVDGDYFHSNPKFYTKPRTKTQKINAYRDKKKNDFCFENNHALIRIWEDDIINNEEEIKCKLRKLLMFER